MKESELLSFALTCLKQSGLVYWRVNNSPSLFNNKSGQVCFRKSPVKGFPDLAGVLPSGKFFAIEIKTDKGRLSPEQIEWITKLNHSGAIAVVLRSKDEIREFVASAAKMKGPPRD
jgi:hypothetical protein